MSRMKHDPAREHAVQTQGGRKMPTLQDVAREAGVSKMTVSNVLNGRRDRVSPATIARITEVVDRSQDVVVIHPVATAARLLHRLHGSMAVGYAA